MAQSPREARVKNAISMEEASRFACLETSAPKATKFTEQELNSMADRLAKIVTLFLVTDGEGSVRSLGAEGLRGGRFADGGRLITFADGRPAIDNVVMTRTAFKSALRILKDAAK